MAPTQAVDRELERLESLWAEGLSDTYISYLEAVGSFEAATGPKLALAAAMIEVGLQLQGLGDRAAPPSRLLMGDLCLARASRLLAGAASQAVQVAFAQAIETVALAAAAGGETPPTRTLLLHALEAGR